MDPSCLEKICFFSQRSSWHSVPKLFEELLLVLRSPLLAQDPHRTLFNNGLVLFIMDFSGAFDHSTASFTTVKLKTRSTIWCIPVFHGVSHQVKSLVLKLLRRFKIDLICTSCKHANYLRSLKVKIPFTYVDPFYLVEDFSGCIVRFFHRDSNKEAKNEALDAQKL